MSDRTRILIACAIAVTAPFISYGLARLGEPSSEWLWCRIIGLC